MENEICENYCQVARSCRQGKETVVVYLRNRAKICTDPSELEHHFKPAIFFMYVVYKYQIYFPNNYILSHSQAAVHALYFVHIKISAL
jgi:hypothetical protein